MTYRRFLPPDFSSGAATLAKVATFDGPEREHVAPLPEPTRNQGATRPRGALSPIDAAAELHERAAIIEVDGGIPHDWAVGFAKLDRSRRPKEIAAPEWLRLINNVGRFLDSWAARAVAEGWTPEDLFGVRPRALGSWYGLHGLVAALGMAEVVELFPDRATLRAPTGALQTYYRHPAPAGEIVMIWDLD